MKLEFIFCLDIKYIHFPNTIKELESLPMNYAQSVHKIDMVIKPAFFPIKIE